MGVRLLAQLNMGMSVMEDLQWTLIHVGKYVEMERYWACNGVMIITMSREMDVHRCVMLKEAGHVVEEPQLLLLLIVALKYVEME